MYRTCYARSGGSASRTAGAGAAPSEPELLSCDPSDAERRRGRGVVFRPDLWKHLTGPPRSPTLKSASSESLSAGPRSRDLVGRLLHRIHSGILPMQRILSL